MSHEQFFRQVTGRNRASHRGGWAFFIFAGKLPFFRQLGRLPGDILIKKKNFTFYFPLATSLIMSIILTLIMLFFRRR